MHTDHRKRRLPVTHRGRRVPGLYQRPKPETDRREGETYEVVFRDETGRQRQKTLKARTVQRAIAEAEEYRTQLSRGEVIARSRLTVSDVAIEWLAMTEAMVASGERSQRTLDLYRQRFAKHIEPAIGRRRVQDVRAEQIASIYTRQRNAQLSAWTISGTHVVVSALLSFALARGYIATNPVARLARGERPRQITQREPRRLSDDQVRRLCASATPRYRPIVTLLAWTGLRVSEALALRWDDINFEEREIRVMHQLDDDAKLKSPKTRAGRRTVPLLPVLDAVLREHRKKQFENGLASAEAFVFTTATGSPLNRHNVRNQGVGAAATKAGLNGEGKTKVTTHDLRRTFISHLILGLGLDPVRVSRIAGHSNVSVTLNTYADEFDKVLHRDDLMSRIEKAGFGSI
jgi:integrase